MEADSADSSKRKATETIDPRPTKAQKTDNNSPSTSTAQNKDIEVIDLEDATPAKENTAQSQPASAKADESAINPNLAIINSILNSGSLPDIKNKAFKGSIFDFGEFFGVIDGPHSGTYVISICLQDQVFSGVVAKNPSVTSSALKELIQKQAPEMSITNQNKSDATISFNNKNANNDAKSATSATAPATSTPANAYQIPPLSSLTDTAAYGEQATRAALSALSQGQFGTPGNFSRAANYPYTAQEELALQQQLLYNQLLQSYQMRQYQQQQAVQDYLQQQYQLQVQLQKQQQQTQASSLKPIQPMPVPSAAVTPAPNLVASSSAQSIVNNTSKPVATSTLKSWTHSGPDKEKQVVFTASSIGADNDKKKKEPIAITTKIPAIKPTPVAKSDTETKPARSAEKREHTKERTPPAMTMLHSGNTVKFKESKEYLHELGFKIVQTILQQYYYQQIASTPATGSAAATGGTTTTNTISIVNNNTNGTPANQPSDPRAPIEIIDK
eukprot:TRINITY_DN9903_c0_g1_i1.p1 TRINITY_DN9903_c0_g1~~TRINITY_DN9903_c0_g1_i1.p1  ORF type:complete len:527 (+),score=116.90 TRINITY_DN9903_c0_g1_i1:81-1583(+)